MDWFTAIVAVIAVGAGMFAIAMPGKVIAVRLWVMPNWHFAEPTEGWFVANSPKVTRFHGILAVVIGLVLGALALKWK